MVCLLELPWRHPLLDEYGRQQPWAVLIGTPTLAKLLAKWFIEFEQIVQFSLAKKLLYVNELRGKLLGG